MDSPLAIQRYDAALPPALIAAVSEMVSELYEVAAPPGTFWEPTNCGRPSLMSAVVSALAPIVPGSGDCVGVEWWARVRSGDEPMSLHQDKDESLLKATGQLSHPHFGSVLYLSDAGGPTIVLEPGPAGATPGVGDQSWAALSWPQRNGFLIFRGDLPHGVGALKGGQPTPRRDSLLMNWWRRRPTAPGCREAPLQTQVGRCPRRSRHVPQVVTLERVQVGDLV
jgi:hypothetical protein